MSNLWLFIMYRLKLMRKLCCVVFTFFSYLTVIYLHACTATFKFACVSVWVIAFRSFVAYLPILNNLLLFSTARQLIVSSTLLGGVIGTLGSSWAPAIQRTTSKASLHVVLLSSNRHLFFALVDLCSRLWINFIRLQGEKIMYFFVKTDLKIFGEDSHEVL